MHALVRRDLVAASALFLAVLIAIAPAAAAAPEAASTEEDSVAKVVDSLILALNDADVNGFTSLFAPDATLFFPLPSLPLRLEDRQQITTAFGAFFEAVRRERPAPPYMNLVPLGTRIQMLGTVAVATFHFKGEELVSRRTVVLQKRSGKWLIVHLHASNLPVQTR
jgi:uncharacterized protein (TIGR02246 family)